MRYKSSEASAWDPRSQPTFWINHVSRLLMRQFERALRPIGFGSAYVPVVGALYEHTELTQRELLERSHIEQPTIAALLLRMERDGLVERAPHPTDGRAVNFALSAKARSRVPRMRLSMLNVAHRALDGFTDAERAAFVGYLERVADNLTTGERDADRLDEMLRGRNEKRGRAAVRDRKT